MWFHSFHFCRVILSTHSCFYLTKFLFLFKDQCYCLQNSSLWQLHIEETFPPLIAALKVFNRYGLQHVRYTEDNAGWRLPALLAKVGTTSPRCVAILKENTDVWKIENFNMLTLVLYFKILNSSHKTVNVIYSYRSIQVQTRGRRKGREKCEVEQRRWNGLLD